MHILTKYYRYRAGAQTQIFQRDEPLLTSLKALARPCLEKVDLNY